MKYLLTVFLCLLSFYSYSQTSDSLLYIRCRNFQTISDSSLTISILSKTEVKIWKDTTTTNTLFIEPKEEGNIKIALTNSENDTVQIMNYKAVYLPLPVIELREGNNKVTTISKKSSSITSHSIPNYENIDTTMIRRKEDLRYRTVDYSVSLKRNGIEIDSATVQGLFLNVKDLMKNAKKGDTIIFKISRVQRLNYKTTIESISLNVEFEYPVLE